MEEKTPLIESPPQTESDNRSSTDNMLYRIVKEVIADVKNSFKCKEKETTPERPTMSRKSRSMLVPLSPELQQAKRLCKSRTPRSASLDITTKRSLTVDRNDEGISYRMLPQSSTQSEEVIVLDTDEEVNSYAAKKTLAQGMMDVALLMANAGQLKYVLAQGPFNTHLYLIMGLIVSSIVLQVAVGCALIINGRADFKGKEAKTSNSYVVLGVFLTAILNTLIAITNVDHPHPHSITTTTAVTQHVVQQSVLNVQQSVLNVQQSEEPSFVEAFEECLNLLCQNSSDPTPWVCQDIN